MRRRGALCPQLIKLPIYLIIYTFISPIYPPPPPPAQRDFQGWRGFGHGFENRAKRANNVCAPKMNRSHTHMTGLDELSLGWDSISNHFHPGCPALLCRPTLYKTWPLKCKLLVNKVTTGPTALSLLSEELFNEDKVACHMDTPAVLSEF